MDYSLPDDVVSFRTYVREFIARHRTAELLAEQGENMRHGYGPHTREFFREMAVEGLTSIAWPVEYGGQGKGALYLWVLTEELSYHGMPFDTLTFNSIGPTIMNFGTEAQKREWLPRIQRYEMNFALGYTEPNAGSDLAGLQTRAVRDGDEWVINGQKIYTSGAHLATHVFLAARSDPDAPKHRGISMFIVPLDTPGISVRPLWTMSSVRTNETFYENVRVPASALVGEENRGWYMLSSALDLERVAIANFSPITRNVERLIQHVKAQRPELVDDAVARTMVADIRIRLEVARALSLTNVALIHNGIVPTMEASMAKVWVSDSRERIYSMAMDLLGRGAAVEPESSDYAIEDGVFQEGWRSSTSNRFGGGTNDIQRRIIACRGLGLPR